MHLLSLKNLKILSFKERHKMKGIKPKNHNLGTYEANKTYVSCFDHKRYILRNGIDTLAYGHKDILNWIRYKTDKCLQWV